MLKLCHYSGQGVGKSTLARKIAESWRCILIDGECNFCISGLCSNIIHMFLTSLYTISDTDLLNTHIKNKTKEGIEVSTIFV